MPVKAIDSLPDIFADEANKRLSIGFCDEVQETDNKFLLPKEYMHDNFNEVMYELMGMEMDYLQAIPNEMWDEMIAETTDAIKIQCKYTLPN